MPSAEVALLVPAVEAPAPVASIAYDGIEATDAGISRPAASLSDRRPGSGLHAKRPVGDGAEGHLCHHPALLAPCADAAEPDDPITQIPDLPSRWISARASNTSWSTSRTPPCPRLQVASPQRNQKRRMPLHLGVELPQQRPTSRGPRPGEAPPPTRISRTESMRFHCAGPLREVGRLA